MKVIKRTELDKMFTETVARYMSKGLFIATRSMQGHQGEDGKVDLTDGKSTYRVLMYHDREEWQETMIIEVRKYDEYVTQNMHTLWNEDGELLEVVCKVYKIDSFSRRRNAEEVYVETAQEAKAISEIQMQRYKGWGTMWKDIPKFDAEKVAEIVRAKGMHGYKRIKPEDVLKVERTVEKARYKISIMNKSAIVIG